MRKEYCKPDTFMKDGMTYKYVRSIPYKWICHWSPFPQYEPSTFECPNCGFEVDVHPGEFRFCPFCGEPIEMPNDKPHSDKDVMAQKAYDEILKRLNDK